MGQSLFSLLRPAYESTPELAAVASQARTENGSFNTLRQQIEFDDKVAQELLSLKLTDSQSRAFENMLSQPGPNVNSYPNRSETSKTHEKRREHLSDAQPRQGEIEEEEDGKESTRLARPRTILFAVGVGLVATISMVIFLISDRLNSFEGADRLSELLESANTLTGDEFEAVETKAGDLQDWFFLKHGLEHYAVPKQFANIKTIGCRVFKFNGTPVAQIMAVTDKEILFYMFQSSDLGIKIGKGKWEIVEDEKWVGGATGINDTCFLVAFKGSKDEMKEFLSSLGR
jgi:hypothetical protein